MKKLLLLLLLVSCSKDDVQVEDCNCQRAIYELTSTVVQQPNGLINLISSYVIQDRYDVGCEEETEYTPLNNNLYYRIECD
jgi:hypothetical protein